MLTEQDRPTSSCDVVGQDKVAQRIQSLAKRGLGGRACWLYGQSGTSETTNARVIAADVPDVLCKQELTAVAMPPKKAPGTFLQ